MIVFVALHTVGVTGDDRVRAEPHERAVALAAERRGQRVIFAAAVEHDDYIVRNLFFFLYFIPEPLEVEAGRARAVA